VPTLRSWQLRYGIGTPERTPGGHRRYAESQVEALRALNAAVARGIAPGTAAQTLRERATEEPPPLSALLRVLDRVGEADQEGVAAALDDAEREYGTEETVDRVLVPAMREVGLRWELGIIDVDLEHAATHAIRRWIARRTRITARRSDMPPVLLAAGPNNGHTVALEAFGMLLDRRGLPILQLGGDTPAAAMLAAVRKSGAQAAVVTAHQVSRSRPTVEALRALQRVLGERLYYAGAAFDNPSRRRHVPGTYLGMVLPDAADVIERDLAPT
jgi:DNA-binding transcriptional MerR regulator